MVSFSSRGSRFELSRALKYIHVTYDTQQKMTAGVLQKVVAMAVAPLRSNHNHRLLKVGYSQ
jgi:hypothetical protein